MSFSELGSGDTWTPDDIAVPHFGWVPGEQQGEGQEPPRKKKQRKYDSRQYRQRKIAGYRRKGQ